jgi:hypothetical protein
MVATPDASGTTESDIPLILPVAARLEGRQLGARGAVID